MILRFLCLGLALMSVNGWLVRRDLTSIFSDMGLWHTKNEEPNDKMSDNELAPPPFDNPYDVYENDDFAKFRIEFIKQQILKKLRMKEPPTVSMADLNKTKEYVDLIMPNTPNEEGFSDDFYEKTTQVVLFPYKDDSLCPIDTRFPSACLPFQMPTDISAADVSSAELTFYKVRDYFDSHNQTFVINQIQYWDSKKSFKKHNVIAIQGTNKTEDWIRSDITMVVKRWLNSRDQDSLINAFHIECKTCGMDKSNSPVSFQTELKPFLTIYTHNRYRRAAVHKRKRRSVECSAGSLECCREHFYVSFADLGWSDWIISPKGYDAYFCKGSCATPGALNLMIRDHGSLVMKLNNKQSKNPRPEITPCCAGTQLQPLELIYLKNVENNKSVIATSLLSDMIVHSCGCL